MKTFPENFFCRRKKYAMIIHVAIRLNSHFVNNDFEKGEMTTDAKLLKVYTRNLMDRLEKRTENKFCQDFIK